MKSTTKTWLTLAKNDLSLAKDLAKKKGRYHYSVHFCHQALEKTLKALISERTRLQPYPTHNFKILLDQSGIKDIPDNIKIFLISMTPHYIGTKYPEDIANLYKKYTQSTSVEILKRTTEVTKWLEALAKSKKS